jgi:hypothetical protein
MGYKFKRRIRKLYAESKSVLDEIEKNVNWIKKYKLPVLQNPRPYIVPSITFPSKIIYFTSLLRSMEISLSFINSFNKFEFFTCTLLARSACELGAYIYFVNDKLNYHLINSDWPTINKLLDKFVIGSSAVGETKPVRSGELIREIRKVIPKYAEAYDDLCEIVHFNVGGKSYYQEIIDDKYVKFRLSKRFEEGDERLLLNPIISMLTIIKYLEKPFLGREFPERLLPVEKNK